LINVKDLKKHYANNKAVDGISLDIKKGTVFGLLGPNGAGKSTVINVLTYSVKRTEGDIEIAGLNFDQDKMAIKRKIGIVPQEISLYPMLSAEDNLRFWGGIYGLKGKELQERIESVLNLVGLNDRKKEKIEQFSGGMKRRINIASALLHKPEIIFFDEPTVGIDPQSRNQIFELIEKLRDEGTTIVYTSHYMEEVERLCSELAIIDKGKIIATGKLNEILSMLGNGFIKIRCKEKHTLIPDLTGIEKVEKNNGHLYFSLSDVKTGTKSTIDWLQANNIDFDDLIIQRPSLENVFLHLTGRDLRD